MELPKFKNNIPSSTEERLIVELVTVLDETTIAFLKLNFDMKKNITNEMLLVLRDGIMNFSGQFIRHLSTCLKYDQDYFLEESKSIFLKQLFYKENS